MGNNIVARKVLFGWDFRKYGNRIGGNIIYI